MTIQEALKFGHQQLIKTTDPTLDARLLLEHVLAKSHAYLAAHQEEQLSAVQEKKYRQLIKRAAHQEPIPYLTGQAHFFGRPFKVNPNVLIPRPETEQLVESALNWASKNTNQKHKIVDVGTGSGCIAITLALALPTAELYAVDISESALTVAKENSAFHQVEDRIHFHLGSLLDPLDNRFTLIIANLPYIADTEWTTLPDGVKSYEPVAALKGGPSGLELIEQMLTQAKNKLTSNGVVFLEIGWKQGVRGKQLAQSIFPTASVRLTADYAGNDRIISIIQPGQMLS